VPRLARAVALSLGTLLLLVGTAAGVVNREVLDADRFAAHVDAVRTDPDVARQLGRLLTTRILREQPDLVALRPLVEATATGVVSSGALGPIVRRSVGPLYNALLLGEDDPVVLRLADAAAVVVAAVTALSPQSVVALPADLDVRLSDIGAGRAGTTIVGPVHLVRLLSWLAPLLGLLVLVAPGLLAPRKRRLRTVAADVGCGVLAAGVILAALLVVTAAVVGRSDRHTLDGAVRVAVWDQLSGRFWAAAAVVVGAGLLIVLVSTPRTDRSRTLLWSALAIVLGLALVSDPARVALALLWVAGLGLLVAGVGTALVTLAHAPAARTWALAAAVVLLVGVVIGAWPGDRRLPTTRTAASESEGCNGHVELCDRRYDDVAFPATHNSMAAAAEPGWFFPEQPDGIVAQLGAGVRALLIDSWYGQATDRPSVVATVGEARDRAVAEADQAFGASAVASALRLVGAAGLHPRGPREAYLCHALCEIGSTLWADSLAGLRSWLDAHPREVVTLVVQEEVSPADTAALIEGAGLLPDVYEPAPGDAWPTLGQMVGSGKRLVVLMERHGGGSAYPWLLQGFDRIQDTPFLFRTPAELVGGPGTCALNRGHADAPLLLLNHWVTDKTAEVTNAALVNAEAVLGARAEACRKERGMLPNFVAVDFYDQGDLFAVVDRLNGVD